MKKSRIDKDPDGFKRAVEQSFSYTEVMRKMGYRYSAGMFSFLKSKISKYSLSTSHFLSQGWAKGQNKNSNLSIKKQSEKTSLTWGDCFKKGSFIKNQALLKRLIENKKKPYQCERCKSQYWNGEPLPLHVHHKNRDKTDNREDNLEILCSNCHNIEHKYGRKTIRTAFQMGLLDFAKVSQFWQRTMNENHGVVGSILTLGTKKMKLYKKICPQCQKEFSTDRIKQKFCSPSCSSKNQRKTKRPNREELEKIIRQKSWVEIGKIYGVSDNCIRKWAKKYEII